MPGPPPGTVNFVTVTGSFFNTSVTGNVPASGGVLFMPSDLVWSTAGLFVGTIQDVGASFDGSGNINNVSLLAMDNANLSTNWTWLCTVTIGGRVFPTRKLTVKFAPPGGPTQDITSLLAGSTLA